LCDGVFDESVSEIPAKPLSECFTQHHRIRLTLVVGQHNRSGLPTLKPVAPQEPISKLGVSDYEQARSRPALEPALPARPDPQRLLPELRVIQPGQIGMADRLKADRPAAQLSALGYRCHSAVESAHIVRQWTPEALLSRADGLLRRPPPLCRQAPLDERFS